MYNTPRSLNLIILIAVMIGVLSTPPTALAENNQPQPAQQTSAYELILAMNTLRVSYGLPALIEDPIIDAVAQSTAMTMAVNGMSWHIGDVRGRLASAGYGDGATVWATENFAMSSSGLDIDQIMAIWADPDHMRPAVEAAYCHVGAGVAQANGKTYYVLQAAYIAGQECSASTSSTTSGTSGGGISQLIIPVSIATPDEDGNTYHVVQAGQSLWSIAIAYQITIADLETWNNISRETPLNAGQRLFIPNQDTEGYATPTPYGMFVPATPNADGKIVHEVQAYQTLSTIADAYQVSVEEILALNGLQADWTLSIGQKLIISPGSVTPSPTLTILQKLTPAADGNYYHTVQNGETLSWIANLYDVPLTDLLTWNGLNTASVIRPGQTLLLLVTPPATLTPVPSPISLTPSPTAVSTKTQPPPTATLTPLAESEPTPKSPSGLLIGLLILLGGSGIGWAFLRKKVTD